MPPPGRFSTPTAASAKRGARPAPGPDTSRLIAASAPWRESLPARTSAVKGDVPPAAAAAYDRRTPHAQAASEGGVGMLETTIAGSLPKPFWLATPKTLWAPWAQQGEALAEAKRDATLLILKEQEDAGILLLLEDRKSTRLNSSHQIISYAVF